MKPLLTICILILLVCSCVSAQAKPRPEERLITAVKAGNVRLADSLLKSGVSPNLRGKDGDALISTAVYNEDTKMVELLLKYKVILTVKDSTSLPPLSMAVNLRQVNMVQDLIRAGSDIEAKDKWGQTPLMYATLSPNQEPVSYTIISILLQHHCNINARDNSGGTALHYAVGYRLERICKQLLTHGADVNAATTDHGTTPLMQAAWDNSTGVVKMFLAYGAKTDLRNAKGETALDIAEKSGNNEVVDLLKGVSTAQPHG